MIGDQRGDEGGDEGLMGGDKNGLIGATGIRQTRTVGIQET